MEFLEHKSILVTGGTGSFGRKFVQTLLDQNKASKIVIFSRDELKQSEMQSSIVDPDNKLRYFIGDIRDQERLEMAFKGIDIVVHAAALKQVPALEYNPFEAVLTNIIGTKNIITAALRNNVQKVLLVSTDKAANPSTLYGATKLCAERLIISANAYSGKGKTRFGAVRYGNVFGSRGSIVKVIEKQRPSGEITLTHEDMSRFWITLDQGVDLVLRALSEMHGGEIFIPKAPSMKVSDFIRTLAPECTLRTVGIRPGEKIHEVLITSEEARHAKEFETHYVIYPEHEWWESDGKYENGEDMEFGSYYSSDNNAQWMTPEELRAMIY